MMCLTILQEGHGLSIAGGMILEIWVGPWVTMVSLPWGNVLVKRTTELKDNSSENTSIPLDTWVFMCVSFTCHFEVIWSTCHCDIIIFPSPTPTHTQCSDWFAVATQWLFVDSFNDGLVNLHSPDGSLCLTTVPNPKSSEYDVFESFINSKTLQY